MSTGHRNHDQLVSSGLILKKLLTTFFLGRTFPVEQFFLEEIMDMTNYVLEENGQYSRKVKKGKYEKT